MYLKAIEEVLIGDWVRWEGEGRQQSRWRVSLHVRIW